MLRGTDGKSPTGPMDGPHCNFTFPAEWPYTGADLRREDEADDQTFYDTPKFVHHIDAPARSALTNFYTKSIPQNAVVLDLCSSWVSHLPPTDLGPVTGIGLNQEELKANPLLKKWIVQDLNKNPNLDFPSGTFDVVVCTVSVDYLIHPLKIFASIHTILKEGGKAIMSFSNRCFPSKVVNIWLRTTDKEHVQIVANYFHFSGFKNISGWDISPPRTDPMFIVEGYK